MEKFDDLGKVVCQECGKSFVFLSSHLTKHNMTTNDYKLKYPDHPLSSNQFKAKVKYGQLNMFKNKKEEAKIKSEEIDSDEILVLEEPVIENIKLPDVKKVKLNTLDQSRENILELLLTYFPSIKQNYLIQKFMSDKRLEYEFITDYADPKVKVIVDFPKTFWHNKDRYVNANRDLVLENDGWKIIKINSISQDAIHKSLF